MSRTLETERQAFAELVEAHGAGVMALLRRLCGRRFDPDDVFQDVALRVWRNLRLRPRFRPRSTRAWLMTIAYRTFLDHLSRCPAHAPLGELDPPEQGGGMFDPIASAERSEERQSLDRAVGDLPEPVRSVLVLHYTGGLTLRETARALDLSVGTVKSRLNAGLEQLRRRMT